MTVLVVENTSKSWDASSGLQPVSLRVDRGEFVVVRGRSGTGKSTLLAIIAGWCTADTGSVSLAGVVAPAEADWWQVAVVPQVLALVPELSVRENIAAAARAGDDLVDQMLGELDLVSVADRPPDATSMGQQQRAAVARAVVACPILLIADEPTSHQDALHADAVLRVLADAAARGAAVLVATHDPAIVAASSRVIELQR